MPEDVSLTPKKQKEGCPICGKSKSFKFNPFCSKYCADYDLRKWLMGDYRIPTNEDKETNDTLPN